MRVTVFELEQRTKALRLVIGLVKWRGFELETRMETYWGTLLASVLVKKRVIVLVIRMVIVLDSPRETWKETRWVM